MIFQWTAPKKGLSRVSKDYRARISWAVFLQFPTTVKHWRSAQFSESQNHVSWRHQRKSALYRGLTLAVVAHAVLRF